MIYNALHFKTQVLLELNCNCLLKIFASQIIHILNQKFAKEHNLAFNRFDL